MNINKRKPEHVLSDVFALLGAKDDLLKIVNNEELKFSEIMTELRWWATYKIDDIKGELVNDKFIQSYNKQSIDEVRSELLDRLDRLKYISVSVTNPVSE